MVLVTVFSPGMWWPSWARTGRAYAASIRLNAATVKRFIADTSIEMFVVSRVVRHAAIVRYWGNRSQRQSGADREVEFEALKKQLRLDRDSVRRCGESRDGGFRKKKLGSGDCGQARLGPSAGRKPLTALYSTQGRQKGTAETVRGRARVRQAVSKLQASDPACMSRQAGNGRGHFRAQPYRGSNPYGGKAPSWVVSPPRRQAATRRPGTALPK